MGFSWDYTLHVLPDFVNKVDNLTQIKEIFEKHGFNIRCYVEKNIKVYSNDDLLVFDTEESCFDFITEFGGMIQFWDSPVNEVGLGVYPENYMMTEIESSTPSQLAIFVDNTYFRNHDNVSKTYAKRVESIFVDLARFSNPIYGFLECEVGEIYESDVRNPRLYEITFLSNQLIQTCPLESLRSHIHHTIRVNSGYLVFFNEFPWETDEQQLELVNQNWCNS